jgi:hypothetical protein
VPEALAAGCFVEVHRPLAEPAPWGARCGPSTVEGLSVNLLDRLPACGAHDKPCAETPGIEIKFPTVDPQEGSISPPSCFAPGARESVRLGWANFGRSCFRGLAATDPTRIQKWSKSVMSESMHCDFMEMGHESHSPDQGGGAKAWAEGMPRKYGSKLTPQGGSAAQAIYASFGKALSAADGCLNEVNPALATRVRQAMGAGYRSGGGVFRPMIECMEQEAFQCNTPPEGCESVKATLQKAYEEPTGENRDTYANRIRAMGCKPAHPEGTVLGAIDAANLKPGAVAEGSPRLQIFNPTAASAGPRLSSTLFHEFLHAAGARESGAHNHGTTESEVPAGDQVYGCQALAFQAFFEKISADDLRRACELCAAPARKTFCQKSEAELQKAGCRSK